MMRPSIHARIFWLIFVAALAGPQAFAGPMMPPGNSPDSGFAGLWRVIDAQVAPWKPPHALTRKEAPLLEYAIEFADRRTTGSEKLACMDARYSSGVTYLSEAFGGAIAADKEGRIAKALSLSNPSITTYRLVCGSTVRDFYVADDADLKFAEHDVVYTLERPTGMDPEQYKPGYSGPSFECVGARRTLDRLICIDAGLSKADSTLGAIYGGVKRSFSPASLASISAAQKAWIASLAPSCGAEGALPDSGGPRNNVADCLKTAYDQRINLLSGLKQAKSGSLIIEPHVRFRARRSASEDDVYPVMSGGAEAGPFNAFIASILHTDRWRTDDRTLFQQVSDDQDQRLQASRTYTIARFDGRIVSFQIATDDFTGGNHDALAQRSIIWDLVKARSLTLDEIFVRGSKWKEAVIAACKRDLQRQLSERGGEIDDSEIAAAVSNSSNWLWKRDAATIVFVIDTVGGLAGGEFEVDVPLKTLAPFLRPDTPVR